MSIALISTLLPWIFSLLGGVVFWVVAKHPIGWILGVIQMLILVPLAILTSEWGFIAQTVIYSAVFVRNYFVTIKDHKLPHELKPKCSGCGNVLKPKVAA